MASSPDCRLSTSLPAHPKTKKLIKRLNDSGAWHLVKLFLWVAQNRPLGDLIGLDDEAIELAIDWPGQVGAFITALAEVGFIDGQPGARKIHDWAEHNPWAAGAQARSAQAKHAVACREANREAKLREAAPGSHPYLADNLKPSADHLADDLNVPTDDPPSGIGSSPFLSLPTPSQKADEPSGSSVRDESRATLDGAGMQKRERLSMVTKDAIETYNAASITIQQGGRLPNVRLVTAERQRSVKRCLPTAQAICKQLFHTTAVTRKFWELYWATVADDPHCSGRAPGGKGHEHWTPDFEYLTRPGVMARLFDKATSAGPEVAHA